MCNSLTSLLYADVITAYEFAEILTEHDSSNKDADFFYTLIWRAVETGNLVPLPIQHTMGNPKFKPNILIHWAKYKGFTLPPECIELIKKSYNYEVATQNHVSQTETTSLQPAIPASDPDLLKEHQKKIGSNGGRKSKAKEALTLLAINEIRHERGFTAFIKMLNEYSSTEPYDGIDECSVIYLDGNNMCYTENENNKSVKTSIAVASMRRYFTNAKKNK